MGSARATLGTCLEALDMAVALVRARRRAGRGLSGEPGSLRAARGRWTPVVSWLDFKLGLRMLLRYPGLTVVGGLAMALGIAIGTSVFHLVTELVFPDHPYEDVDRIVGVQNFDIRRSGMASRSLRDFAEWRRDLRSVEHLGVRREGIRTSLDTGDGRPMPVVGVSTTAEAFVLAPAPPHLGRPLLASDDVAGAPAVVVLSHEIWEERFDGALDVVGRTVRLGGDPTTVVGVMPPRFALHVPSNDLIYPGGQDLWVPFRLNPLAYEAAAGPRVTVFGRLAEGVSPDQAQAELTSLGVLATTRWPATHSDLRPQIRTFANPFGPSGGLAVSGVLTLAGGFIVLVMVILCANVALLVFTRAATRDGELVVRSALGASRTRIVSQLFAEALALAVLALGLGVAGASLGLDWFVGMIRTVGSAADVTQPWIEESLSLRAVSYAAILGLAGAVVAGILPGLNITRGSSGRGLQKLAHRGSVSPFGRLWNAFIVAQVGLTAMLVPVLVMVGVQSWKVRAVDYGFPAQEYLSARLEMDDGSPLTGGGEPDVGFGALFEERYRDLARRVMAEPGVRGVTFGAPLPGSPHPEQTLEFEASTGSSAVVGEHRAQVATVDPGFFEVMEMGLVEGRAFGAVDQSADARSVVVNESFVREALNGAGAVGRRFRYLSEAFDAESPSEAPWFEIVGVVTDVRLSTDPTQQNGAGVYRASVPGDTYPVHMAVHVGQAPGDFAGRLRDLARQVSPALRIHQPMPMEEAGSGVRAVYAFFFRVLFLIGGFVLLLTVAGIYAMLALTVSRRTREIGVRVALGAPRVNVVSSVVSRIAPWVTTGALLGSFVGVRLAYAFAETPWEGSLANWAGVPACLFLMLALCLLPSVVPIRRALAIEPSQAVVAEV